jgi:hypothetical protein
MCEFILAIPYTLPNSEMVKTQGLVVAHLGVLASFINLLY